MTDLGLQAFHVAQEHPRLTRCGPVERGGNNNGNNGRCLDNDDVKDHAVEFANDQDAWLEQFAESFQKMVEVGYGQATNNTLSCVTGVLCVAQRAFNTRVALEFDGVAFAAMTPDELETVILSVTAAFLAANNLTESDIAFVNAFASSNRRRTVGDLVVDIGLRQTDTTATNSLSSPIVSQVFSVAGGVTTASASVIVTTLQPTVAPITDSVDLANASTPPPTPVQAVTSTSEPCTMAPSPCNHFTLLGCPSHCIVDLERILCLSNMQHGARACRQWPAG